MPIQRSGTGAPLGLPMQRRPLSLSRQAFDRGYRVSDVLKQSKQREEDARPRGLLEQLTDTASGIFTGAIKMGGGLAKSVVSTPLKLVDLAQGDISGLDFAQSLAPDFLKFGNAAAANVAGYGQPAEIQQRINDMAGVTIGNRYDPVQTGAGTSWGNTILDVRHPSRFGDAVREGRIVDKVIEDASNIAMVAAPVAKLAGGAGMTRTAGVARVASQPLRSSFRGIGRAVEGAGATNLGVGIRQLGEGNVIRNSVAAGRDGIHNMLDDALGATGTRRQGVAQSLQRRLPLAIDPAGRAAREAGNKGALHGGRAVNNEWHESYRLAEQSGLDPVAEGTAAALFNGVGAGDRFLTDALNMPADQVRALHATVDLPEQAFTPEIQQAVRDYMDGTMDPEMVAKVDTLRAAITEQMGKLTAARETGNGVLSGPLDPQQLGDAPVDARMFTELEQLGVDQAARDAMQAELDAGMSWEDIAGYTPEVRTLLDTDYTVYPSPWRPVMRQMSLAREAGHQVPWTPDELLAAGIERPGYLPGGESNLFVPPKQRLTQEPLNRGLGGLEGMSSEQLRSSAEIQPYSLRTITEKVAEQYRTMASNEATSQFVNDPRVKNVGQLIDAPTLARYRQAAEREAAAMYLDPQDARRADKAASIFGNKVLSDLEKRGYEVLQGDINNPQVGDFAPTTPVTTSLVGPDSIATPIGVRGKMVKRMTPKETNIPLEVLRYVNKKFKGAVLPFSLRWQMGDAVGGAFMSWVGGGIPPNELFAAMRKLKELSPDAEAAILRNPEFTDKGLTMQELDYRRAGIDPPKEPKTAFGRFQRKSFELNNTINHYNRGGYLLAKVDRLLRDNGLSVDSVDNAGAWDSPAVQKAIGEAVADANKTMGAFDQMTPFERRWMREVLPFYAWTRHITQLAFRTAIDNPARIMWTMRLGSIGTDPNEDLPEWLRGSLKIPDGLMPDALFGPGDGVLPTQFINPFNDVFSTPGFSPAGIARGLSPAIKVPLAAVGLEPSARDQWNPIQPITRPYGQERGLGQAFQDTLYAGLRSFPLSREAINLAPTSDGGWWSGGIGTGPNVRYHSGDLMIGPDGKPIQSPTASPNPRALIPFRLTGIPLPTNAEDAAAIVQAQEKRAAVGDAKKKKVRVRIGQTTPIKIRG